MRFDFNRQHCCKESNNKTLCVVMCRVGYLIFSMYLNAIMILLKMVQNEDKWKLIVLSSILKWFYTNDLINMLYVYIGFTPFKWNEYSFHKWSFRRWIISRDYSSRYMIVTFTVIATNVNSFQVIFYTSLIVWFTEINF